MGYIGRIHRYCLKGRVRKAKAQLELKLAMDVEGRRKAFYKYTDNKRKANENVDPLCNLVTKDMEKAGALNPFFVSISGEKLWP